MDAHPYWQRYHTLGLPRKWCSPGKHGTPGVGTDIEVFAPPAPRPVRREGGRR